MSAQEFLVWDNLIFYLALVVGMAFMAATFFGFDGDFEGVDADADVETSVAMRALSIFGIGKCPISIIIFSGLLIFSGTGIVLNLFMPPMLRIFSIGAAVFAMFFFTRIIASVVARIMPNTETYEVKPDNFIGLEGTVLTRTDNKFGTVKVRDSTGTLHTLTVKTLNDEVYKVHQKVLVLEFKDNAYYVADPLEI